MSTLNVFVISLLTAVSVVAGSVWWMKHAYAHDQSVHGILGHGANPYHKTHARLGERFCNEGISERINDFSETAVKKLALNDTQKIQWDAFAGAVKSNAGLFNEHCGTFMDKQSKGMTPQKLVHLEGLLSTGIQFVQSITPYYESFYNSLTEEQKFKLSEHAPRRHWR